MWHQSDLQNRRGGAINHIGFGINQCVEDIFQHCCPLTRTPGKLSFSPSSSFLFPPKGSGRIADRSQQINILSHAYTYVLVCACVWKWPFIYLQNVSGTECNENYESQRSPIPINHLWTVLHLELKLLPSGRRFRSQGIRINCYKYCFVFCFFTEWKHWNIMVKKCFVIVITWPNPFQDSMN